MGTIYLWGLYLPPQEQLNGCRWLSSQQAKDSMNFFPILILAYSDPLKIDLSVFLTGVDRG